MRAAKALRFLRNAFIIGCVSTVLFLAMDFILYHVEVLRPIRLRIVGDSGILRIPHPVYHHDLRPDTEVPSFWIGVPWNGLAVKNGESTIIATDGHGFKSDSNPSLRPQGDDFDIGFIGDSFTEGVGVAYEKTFVGRFARRHPALKVANLGVSTYSPSLYYRKIRHYLERGMTFKHILVFIDISDIQDEAVLYSPDMDFSHLDSFWMRILSHFPTTFYNAGRLNDYLYSSRGMVNILFEEPWDRFSANWTYMPDAPGYGEKGIEGGVAQALDVMRRLKRLLDEHDIRLSIGSYPWPNQLKHDTREHRAVTLWRSFAKEENIPFINANDRFFEEMEKIGFDRTYEKYYIKGDVHFNEEGNAVIFEEIERQWSSTHLAPDGKLRESLTTP